jgi:hypothetical protein
MDTTLKPACTLVLACLVATSAPAELQLRPDVVEYEMDGSKMICLAFFDGEQRITYTPPHGWTYTGSANALILRPPSCRGEASITRSSAPARKIFDAEAIRELTDEALLSVPEGANNVSLVSVEKNHLMIERKETLLIIFQYDFYGEPQERSVMLLNRKGELLRFQLTSPKINFSQLQTAFLSSQFSWQNL